MKLNTTLLIISGLVVAAGAYWYFFGGSGNDLPLTPSATPSEAQAQFETYARQLPISLNTSIFDDPRFAVLVDITTPITPEPLGRADPLAPFSASGQ